MSSRTESIVVSRSNISSWIETGLRQVREIQDGEDVVSLEVSPRGNGFVTVTYTIKEAEPEMEVFRFG